MTLVIAIGFIWAVRRGFVEVGTNAYDRGKTQAKKQGGKASDWWKWKQSTHRSARAANALGRVLRGIFRGGRTVARDFKRGLEKGWSEREQAAADFQRWREARLPPVQDRVAEVVEARAQAEQQAADEAEGDESRFRQERVAAAELAGRLDHPVEEVPPSQQCSWCEAPATAGMGTPNQACQGHHEQFDLPNDISDSDPMQVTQTDSGQSPVMTESEFIQAMSVTTGEATTYEAAVATYRQLEQQAQEVSHALESAINSLRSAGCNGDEIELLVQASDAAVDAATKIKESGQGFQQRQGNVAEAMHAAGGQVAVANDSSFYVQ